jgi:hypothetical protein
MYGIISQPSQNRFTKQVYEIREIRVRGYGKLSSLPVNPAVYPDSTNTTKLAATVKVTLRTTLTSNENRHPLPIV